LRALADAPVASGSALFAATPIGVRRSDDVGEHWAPVAATVPGLSVNGASYALGDARSVVLAVSEVDRKRVLALDWQQKAIVLSKDGGATWLPANLNLSGFPAHRGAIAAAPIDPPDSFDAVFVVQAGGTFGST